MNATLRRRIELLEARVSSEPLVLAFADGSQKIIQGSTRRWQSLNAAAMLAADGAGPLTIELQWLRDCLTIEGQNEQVFNLTKVLLAGGVECEEIGLHEV